MPKLSNEFTNKRMHLSRWGMTLPETLIVISIIGLLATLLLPAIQSARQSARQVTCGNHLRQLAVASQAYEATYKTFPAGVDQRVFKQSPVYRGVSLFALMLPYFERSVLAISWDFDDPMNNLNGDTKALAARSIPILLCPSDKLPKRSVVTRQGWHYALTSYGGNGGMRNYFPDLATVDGIFHTTGRGSEPQPDQQAIALSAINDGLSQTILLGERSHADANFESFADALWVEPLSQWGWWGASGGRKAIGHVTMSAHGGINFHIPFSFEQRLNVNPPVSNPQQFQDYHDRRVSSWGSNHRGGANFVFADSSLRMLSESISLDVLHALSTRSASDLPY